MKLLFTGFEPFGGEAVNPAWQAVCLLPGEISGARIETLEVPTVFGAAGETLAAAMERLRPDAVVCVGQAGGRSAVSVERVAVNLRDARIPDNAGNRPSDEPVLPGGPAAFFSTLPVRAIAEAIRREGIPAELSCSAGTYVCNDLFYSLLELAARQYPGMAGGFLHIPYSMAQAAAKPAGTPGMEPETAARALAACARILASGR